MSVAALLLASCVSHPDVPSTSKDAQNLPAIFPDYCDVTVPCNIAPLNFMLADESAEACIAEVSYPDGKLTYGEGCKVLFDENEWREMLQLSSPKVYRAR